ncbi:MAG TPA: hypothetical protein VE057_14850 [Archangium sp.]|nr:hypothetical protein [Archangium sp.]
MSTATIAALEGAAASQTLHTWLAALPELPARAHPRHPWARRAA